MRDNLKVGYLFSNLQIFHSFRIAKFEIKIQFRVNIDKKT